jgi:tRNA(fMet)-specific endonuclease VapC
MIYLLDTNTCIAYINRRNRAIRERLNSLSPDDVAICDLVKYELYYGACR